MISLINSSSMSMLVRVIHQPYTSRRRERLGFDLDLPARIEQASDHNHGRGRADVTEQLTVHGADRGAVGRVGDEHPGPDDVGKSGTRLGERRGDDLEAPPRLD